MLLLTAVITAYSHAADFKIRPTGRALFDAAAYASPDTNFVAGVGAPDIRLGALMNFDKFEARVDIGYIGYRFIPTDIYLKYKFDDHHQLEVGYFVHQFGLQFATGASSKIGMEEPIAQSAFGEPRMPGIMYEYTDKNFLVAPSIFAQSSAVFAYSDVLGRTGVGAMARFVWHPRTADGDIFQLGVTPLMQTAEFAGDAKNGYAAFKSRYPTKVANVNCLNASIDSVRSIFKITPEILWSHGRWAAEGQFYFLNVDRKGTLPSFHGMGGYVQTRTLLNRNARYSYSPLIGYLATPGAGSWEIVCGYSYVDLSDIAAGIHGGRANSASFTLNYYIHKYVTARLNYNYTRRSAEGAIPSQHVNIFQTRIQFMF